MPSDPSDSSQLGRAPRRGWERHRVAVLAGTVLGLLLPFCWLVVVLHAGPSDGTGVTPTHRWGAGDVVVSRTFGPTPLRKGDRVVAIDGVPVGQWTSDRGPHVERRVGDVVEYTIVRDGTGAVLPVRLRSYPLHEALRENWVLVALVASLSILAAVVTIHRPHDHAAWVLVGLAVVIPLFFTRWPWSMQAIDLAGGRGIWPAVVGEVAWTAVWGGLLPHFALVFPEPPAAVRRRPWLVSPLYVVPGLICGGYLVATLPATPHSMDRLDRMLDVLAPVTQVAPVVIVGFMVWAYLRTTDRRTRERMRWVCGTLLLAVLVSLLFDVLPSALIGRPLLPPQVEPLMFLLCALAVAAGILRYQLFDIEVILKRSIVYGILTAVLLALYAGTFVVMGQLFADRRTFVALCATAVVALCFHPLRTRLRRFVSRLIYGERDDPYEVVSRLGRMEPGDSPERLLPKLAATLAHALRLPFVRIELDHPDGTVQAVASFGDEPRSHPLTVPLKRGREVTGRLLLDVGAGREPFGPAELRLLDDVCSQIGGAVQTALLAEALQRSRQRVIAGREEERRRIRRDLHDGLGPTLAAVVMQLDAAHALLKRDPETAEKVLAQVRHQARTAIADVRRVVDELRPAALDQLGLVGAIRERARYFASGDGVGRDGALQIRVDADGDLESLPAAVEVAAFGIAMEAVNNAARHSGGSECAVWLWRDAELHLEVRDDGRGMPESVAPGVGLSSMRERALELGGTCRVQRTADGGTVVRARIPLEPVEETP